MNISMKFNGNWSSGNREIAKNTSKTITGRNCIQLSPKYDIHIFALK